MSEQKGCLNINPNISMVSCQKGPTCHAYAWQIGPFWQDTLDIWYIHLYDMLSILWADLYLLTDMQDMIVNRDVWEKAHVPDYKAC